MALNSKKSIKLANIFFEKFGFKVESSCKYVVHGFAIRKKLLTLLGSLNPFLTEKFPSFDEHVGILKSQKNSSNFKI